MVSIVVSPNYGVAPLMTGFFVTVYDSGEDSRTILYNWDFGDGGVSTSPIQPVFHTYKNPGSYVARLTVTTADGHTATAFTGIIVRPPRVP